MLLRSVRYKPRIFYFAVSGTGLGYAATHLIEVVVTVRESDP